MYSRRPEITPSIQHNTRNKICPCIQHHPFKTIYLWIVNPFHNLFKKKKIHSAISFNKKKNALHNLFVNLLHNLFNTVCSFIQHNLSIYGLHILFNTIYIYIYIYICIYIYITLYSQSTHSIQHNLRIVFNTIHSVSIVFNTIYIVLTIYTCYSTQLHNLRMHSTQYTVYP